MIPDLSELQRDALVEIFNIGVGQAANSMSQIVGEAITLSVPKIELLSSSSQAEAIGAFIPSARICAVSQDFSGSLDATALLIFPEGKTREIVRRMIGESVSADELSEMEQEALSEIGNIILNACFSAFSDVLHTNFQSSLPSYHLGSFTEVMAAQNNNDGDLVLLLHIDFSLPSDAIDGYLVFLLTLPSFNVLIGQLNKFLAGINGN